MDENDKTYRIFLSAGEASSDAHCAGLINALKKSDKKIEFFGVGGDKMEEAGCELLEKTTLKAMMLYKVFAHLIHFIKMIRRINRYVKRENFDLVILCDSPAFNFHVAKAAKNIGIKTLFYVAPQLWAWAPWRIKKLQKCCDKLACILPFEENWFRQRNIDTTFVGNPLLDELDRDLSGCKKKYSNFDIANTKIALMPGSRSAEIDSLWPPMQKIAIRLKRKYPNITITTVALDSNTKEILKSMQVLGFKCKYVIGSVNETALISDFTLVASGSATLQVAAAGCPMVIMYQISRALWHFLGRWLVQTKFFSLVNVIGSREVVPEFMPYFSSIDPIFEKTEQLLKNKEALTRISSELVDLAEPLGAGSAAEKVADLVLREFDN